LTGKGKCLIASQPFSVASIVYISKCPKVPSNVPESKSVVLSGEILSIVSSLAPLTAGPRICAFCHNPFSSFEKKTSEPI